MDGNVRSEAIAREIRWPARRVALWWLAGYLAASGAVQLRAGSFGAVALHLLLIGAAVVLARGEGGVAGDLLPLVVAPLLYFEIPSLIQTAGSAYHDASVQQIESLVFGAQASQIFATAAPWKVLSELVHAGYLAYYPMIFLPALVLLIRGDRNGAGRTVLVLTVVFTVCWTIYALYPVQGPRYLWTSRPDVPSGPIRRFAVSLVGSGSARGTAFPSSHVAVMVAQGVAAWWTQRRFSVAVWIVAILVGIGAVYGGFHYAVDVVTGAVLGGVLAAVVMAATRTAQEPRTAD